MMYCVEAASPPEGLIGEATCVLPTQPLQVPSDEQVLIDADSTLAFSAWAMGSAANPATDVLPCEFSHLFSIMTRYQIHIQE